jgi:PPIC-type PPIASE domain
MGMRIGGRRNAASVFGLAGAAAVGFWLGRGGPESAALAGPPNPPAANAPASPAAAPSDYSQRVVAYIHGTVPITREELGEYLIARYGHDRLEMFVNRRIIEMACQKRGIDVTEAEVNAAIDADCAKVGIERTAFINEVLTRKGKSLYEWKEDVIKPGLMLTKLCVKEDRVRVTDDDLRQTFDAAYGPKVECRIIIWPEGEQKVAMQMYDKLRKSEEEFDRAARSQAMPDLAAVGGRIRPIARFSGTHPEVEKEAYSLKPGELSRLIVTKQGTVCLKCDKQIPADPNVKFEEAKEAMRKEVFEKKIEAESKKLFLTLKDEAKPALYLKKKTSAEELKRDVETELKQAGGIEKKPQ